MIYNFTKEIKDDYNISFVTGLVGENEWEYKFKEITPNIYHLHNLFGQDKKMYLEFISNYIKTRNIDILHIIHTNYVFEMLPELKRKHPNLKVIVTMFNDKVQYFGESLKLEKVVDYYSTDNNQVRDSYKKSLEINKNIKVIPNGIDGEKNFNSALYDKEEVRNRLRLEENDKAVFFVGRLSKEKNPDIFVETAKKFVADKHLKFFIIGDGPMKNEIEKSLEDKKIHNIKYLGYKKPEEVAEYLTVCDIFVLPSAIEGFPLSILEAMAMKTAVIASRIGAMPDILKDGYTGFVVTPGSSEEIAQRIQKIYKDNVRLNTIKNNARKDFEEKYSNKILKKNYEAFYRELLS